MVTEAEQAEYSRVRQAINLYFTGYSKPKHTQCRAEADLCVHKRRAMQVYFVLLVMSILDLL